MLAGGSIHPSIVGLIILFFYAWVKRSLLLLVVSMIIRVIRFLTRAHAPPDIIHYNHTNTNGADSSCPGAWQGYKLNLLSHWLRCYQGGDLLSITQCLYNVPHFHAVMCLCHLSSWIQSTQIPGNCPAGVDIKARRLDILYQCWGEQFAIWVNIDKSPPPPLHIVWCAGYQVELSQWHFAKFPKKAHN